MRFFECEVFFFGTAHRKGPSQSGSWKVVALKMVSLRLLTSADRPKRAVDAGCVIDVLNAGRKAAERVAIVKCVDKEPRRQTW